MSLSLKGFSASVSRRRHALDPPSPGLKQNAFHVFVTNLRVRDHRTLERICSIFQFENDDDLYWNIRGLFGRRKNYAIGSALVSILNLFHKFDVEDIFVQLLQGDQIQVFTFEGERLTSLKALSSILMVIQHISTHSVS